MTEFVSSVIESMENSSAMGATLFKQSRPQFPIGSMVYVGSSLIKI